MLNKNMSTHGGSGLGGKKFTILLFSIAFLFMSFSVLAEEENKFNPNLILSDSELLDATSMNLNDIQTFLAGKGSYLANYKCENYFGEIKTAAQIIYDASRNNYDCEGITLNDKYSRIEVESKCTPITTVNPKFLLVLLQKEMSLITDTSPTQNQLDFATGYGCPDGGNGCSDIWKGFGKQVNSAALQFVDYMDNSHRYTYKAGETYTFTNPYSTINDEINIVTPANQATAALYNYTPHVYNGNYNFFNLWKKYFTRESLYPNGTLLQAEGEPGVWLIQNGMKRPFLNKSALTSRFDINKIITVNKLELDAYMKGAPIKFPQYSVIRSSKGDLYLLVDNKKRKFSSDEAFRLIGINPEEILDANSEDLTSYIDGQPITEQSTYPTGALLQNNKTGGVYWVIEGEKAPILDKIFLSTKFKNKKIIPVSPEELENYIVIDPILFENGELVKSPNAPIVYLLDDGAKRPIADEETFLSLGYKWQNIITVSPKVLYYYDNGEILRHKYETEDTEENI